MKKLIFYLAAVLCALTTSAQTWQEPSSQDYNKEHVIYATFDGLSEGDEYVLGAFIDGECRGFEGISSAGPANDIQYFALRVKGSAEDAGKNISFKVYDGFNDTYYSLPKTVAYEPEGTTGTLSNLFDLSFVKADSFQFTDDTVELYVGTTYNIEYSVIPEDGILPDGFDDAFVAQQAQAAQVVSIQGKTVTAEALGEAYIYNSLLGEGSTLTINVINRPIPVESIIANPEGKSTELYVYDKINLNEYFAINPANASNKAVTITTDNDHVSITESPVAQGMYTLSADSKGTTVVTITSEENPSISAQITFTIKQHVEWISMKQGAEFNLTVGQTINLSDYYMIGPDDADNKAVTVTTQSQNVNIGGSGENWTLTTTGVGRAEVIVTSVDNPEATTRLFFSIIQLVESITVEPNHFDITVGEKLTCGRQFTITVSPAEAEQSYTLSTDSPEIVEIENAGVAAASVTGLKKGTAVVTVTANDGSNVSTTFTVNVFPELIDFTVSPSELTISSRSNAVVTITPNPSDALVKGEVTFTIDGPSIPNEWTYAEGEIAESRAGGYELTLTPACMGEGTLNVYHNGSSIANVPLHIGYEYNVESGWNWVSVFSNNESSAKQTMQQMIGNNLVEARTQDELLCNDPVYGYFGNFTDFGTEDKFYKLKVNNSQAFMLFGSYNNATDIPLRSGWNWIPYTCEFNQVIELDGNDGDVILSLTDGVATLVDGAWEPVDFQLKAGQGYLYYSEQAGRLTLPAPFSCEQNANAAPTNAPSIERSHWTYNPRLYSSIMPVIAVIDGYDTDNYTVGAFVGDECRGEGRLVNGKWFITVAGENGEEVRFVIYNKSTDTDVNVLTTVNMASKVGSAKAPISLEAEEAAFSSLRAIEATANESDEYYDLFGRRVLNPGKGIYIVNGRKVIVK